MAIPTHASRCKGNCRCIDASPYLIMQRQTLCLPYRNPLCMLTTGSVRLCTRDCIFRHIWRSRDLGMLESRSITECRWCACPFFAPSAECDLHHGHHVHVLMHHGGSRLYPLSVGNLPLKLLAKAPASNHKRFAKHSQLQLVLARIQWLSLVACHRLAGCH